MAQFHLGGVLGFEVPDDWPVLEPEHEDDPVCFALPGEQGVLSLAPMPPMAPATGMAMLPSMGRPVRRPRTCLHPSGRQALEATLRHSGGVLEQLCVIFAEELSLRIGLEHSPSIPAGLLDGFAQVVESVEIVRLLDRRFPVTLRQILESSRPDCQFRQVRPDALAVELPDGRAGEISLLPLINRARRRPPLEEAPLMLAFCQALDLDALAA